MKYSVMLLPKVSFKIYNPWSCAYKSITCMAQHILCSKEAPFLMKHSTSFGIQYNLRNHSTNKHSKASLTEAKESENLQLTLGEKVKEGAKDVTYLGIIIAGVGITGIMFYAIIRELFSGDSPNSVYTEALKLCRNDPAVSDSVGEPIKGYGEMSARGRRGHVSHVSYLKDDINHMRMKFYIEGSKRKGTVHLEIKGNRPHEYRYLFVELEGYPRKTIILKDNRKEITKSFENLEL